MFLKFLKLNLSYKLLNYLRFTDEGQRQNPEVPGNGPAINIDSVIARLVYLVVECFCAA